jgi:glycerol-3-phosphate dehydrogenase
MNYLSHNYGAEYAEILKLAREDKALAETLNEDGEILAEVVYAIRQEMARTLSDIVVRRTGIGTLGNPGEDVLRKVAAIAAMELHWDEKRVEQEISDTQNLLKLPV